MYVDYKKMSRISNMRTIYFGYNADVVEKTFSNGDILYWPCHSSAFAYSCKNYDKTNIIYQFSEENWTPYNVNTCLKLTTALYLV